MLTLHLIAFMSSTTLKTLAKELQLSVATVSKALRDSHEISSETKEKVFALAKKLNYVPNPYASGLRKKMSKTIGVVIPEVADSFFSEAINGIESVAQDQGYHTLIYLTHERYDREKAILQEFQSGRVDGILISVSGETSHSDHISQLMDEGLPVVFFDRVCEDIDAAKVITDDFESGYKATTHLIEQGCHKIVFLSASSSLSISNHRMNGYKKALEDHRFEKETGDALICSNDSEENYALIKKIMSGKNRPDGIIACVEKFTPAIYLTCKDLKLSIPGDIKVISFTNLPTAAILDPPLTTVTQPAFEMGKAAALVLFKRLLKNDSYQEVETTVIPSVLTIRSSSSQRAVS